MANKVTHLPVYQDNPYQRLLFGELRKLGIEVNDGGGGGSFLRSALFRWKSDVVHFHWLHPYIVRPSWLGTALRGLRFLLELLALRIARIRLVWTVHNVASHDSRFPTIERLIQRLAARLFHVIVVHSEFSAKFAASELGRACNQFRVVHHPSYIGYYANTVDKREARRKLELADDNLVFLFLGRIASYKGIDELVQAFKELSDDAARMLIAGNPVNPSEHRIVSDLCRSDPRISLYANYIPDDDIQYYMNASDAVVFPFRQVLNSGSLVMAAGFGRPVIAPRMGSLSEMVPAEYPLLYDSSRKNSLRDTLQIVSSERMSLPALGDQCRIHVGRFTWSKYARELLDAYAFSTQIPQPGCDIGP